MRFTRKGEAVYAFIMGWPDRTMLIRSLSTVSPRKPLKIANVQMLGYEGRLEWSQEEQGLNLVMPAVPPCRYAVTLKLT